jgi:hypothetical protein
MADQKRIAVFAEDRGHEEFLRAVIERRALEMSLEVEVRVQSARGGQGRVLNELRLFQEVLLNSMSGVPLPDLIVVGIDSNCEGLIVVRQQVRNALDPRLSDRTVIACPDPHVEIWYLSDPKAFAEAIGSAPRLGRKKCEKDRYKQILAKAVADAGNLAPLGGIEFAREIVARIDWHRASRSVNSLEMFLSDLRAGLNRIKGA